MDTIEPKNRLAHNAHQDIDSKVTAEDLKGLAISLFSNEHPHFSKHYAVLNALFEKPESHAVISLIRRVMHIFWEEQEKLLTVQPPFQNECFSISSYDKKIIVKFFSIIYTGALRTIQDFLAGKVTKFSFQDYSFALRMTAFSELDVQHMNFWKPHKNVLYKHSVACSSPRKIHRLSMLKLLMLERLPLLFKVLLFCIPQLISATLKNLQASLILLFFMMKSWHRDFAKSWSRKTHLQKKVTILRMLRQNLSVMT